MEINGFDEARALKWLKYYRARRTGDDEIVESSAKSFQEETGYTNQRMIPVVKYMWKSQIESQH